MGKKLRNVSKKRLRLNIRRLERRSLISAETIQGGIFTGKAARLKSRAKSLCEITSFVAFLEPKRENSAPEVDYVPGHIWPFKNKIHCKKMKTAPNLKCAWAHASMCPHFLELW